jgi:hypothetical protein
MGAFAWLLLKFLPGIEPILTNIENFIVKHWKGIVICMMIGTIGYQNFSDHRFVLWIETIPYLENKVAADQVQIKKLTSDLEIAAKANAMLTGTIQQDNSTVEQWKAVSDQLQKKNDALIGQLSTIRANNNKKVQTILDGTTPTTCEASIDYLRNIGPSLTW